MTERNPLLSVVNASGFPLQIAVEHMVRATRSVHGWDVRYVEHSWLNRINGRSGFIDLVLCNQYGTSSLVVECKRVRDTAWVFMSPDGSDKSRGHCKSWIRRYSGGSMTYFGWQDLVVSPATAEASYCTVRGQTDSSPMLERVASELVLATEALANEERDYRPNYENIHFYFNIIVTTAELMVCSFDPAVISLANGSLETADFKAVPYIRFRKQLTANGELFTPDDYATGMDPSKRKEHTVFVVNSSSLADFLTNFDINNDRIRPFI